MSAFDAAVFMKFLAAFLAMVNPLLALPIFVSMTKGYSRSESTRTALIVSATVAITGLLAVLAGEEMLSVFGIGIPAFRVAGGIIILGIALTMLNAEPEKPGDVASLDTSSEPNRSKTIVPLAIPLTIGPGALVTSIVFAHQMDDQAELFTLVPAVILVTSLLGVSLLFAGPIARFLGDSVMNVVSRILAIVLAGIAVEMVLTGLGDEAIRQFPALTGQSH